MGQTPRTQKVGALLQQEISKLFTKGMKDPRIGMVTITGAKVSPDLREAWVYWSVLGDEATRKETKKGLESAKGFIKRHLSKAVQLRTMPDLHFVFDESIARGDRIEHLLREVKEQDQRRLADSEELAKKAPPEDEEAEE